MLFLLLIMRVWSKNLNCTVIKKEIDKKAAITKKYNTVCTD